MASVYGMSDIAGLMVLEKRTNQFLGGQTQKDFSDDMAKNLDNYVRETLNERYQIVLQALRDNNDAIEEMTKELLEIEVISGQRVREIIKDNGGTVYEAEDLHSDAVDENNELVNNDEPVKKQKDTKNEEDVENSTDDSSKNSDSETTENNEENKQDKKED